MQQWFIFLQIMFLMEEETVRILKFKIENL